MKPSRTAAVMSGWSHQRSSRRVRCGSFARVAVNTPELKPASSLGGGARALVALVALVALGAGCRVRARAASGGVPTGGAEALVLGVGPHAPVVRRVRDLLER